VVACVANNVDPASIDSVTCKWADGEGVIFAGLEDVVQRRDGTENPVVSDFNESMSGNVEFKTLEKDEVAVGILNPENIKTVEIEYNGIKIKVSASAAAALKNNTFSGMGAEVLLGKVDTVANIASLLIADALETENGNTISNLITDEYLANLASSLGYNLDDETEAEAFEELASNSDFLANSLVLTAAQKTQGMGADFLLEEKVVSTLRTQLDSEDPDEATEAMAKLAMTYGLYTSYCKFNNQEDKAAALIEKENTLTGMTSVLSEVESEAFKTYLASEQGQKDLAAYQASMQIVNDSASSTDAAKQILTNGFTDTELEKILSGLMGK